MDIIKKVVISGYYGWDNIGDDAILKHISETLKRNGLTPVVICNNPLKVKEQFGVEVIERTDFKAIKLAIKGADAFISGGGSLIQDVTSKKSAMYYLLILVLANLYLPGKTFVYGQGVGPIKSSFIKSLTKVAFSGARKVLVRDEESKSLLTAEMKLKKDVELMVDPVLSGSYDGKLELKLSEDELGFLEKKPIILSIKNNINDERMVTCFRNLCKTLREEGIFVGLIPFHHEQDLQIANRIAEGFSTVRVFERKLSLEEAKYILDKAEIVVGMRLHSLIMAATVNTPIIPISYDPKIDAFAKMIGTEVVFDIHGFNYNKLLTEIKKIQNDYFYHKEKLNEKTESLKKINEKIDEEIVRIIKGD